MTNRRQTTSQNLRPGTTVISLCRGVLPMIILNLRTIAFKH